MHISTPLKMIKSCHGEPVEPCLNTLQKLMVTTIISILLPAVKRKAIENSIINYRYVSPASKLLEVTN